MTSSPRKRGTRAMAEMEGKGLDSAVPAAANELEACAIVAPVAAPPPRGRLYVGGALFLLGVFAPAFVPLVAMTSLSIAWKTTISGALILGIPELLFLAAAAVLGKPGFAYLTARLKHRLRRFLQRYGPPAAVSRRRHRIGLALFLAPLACAWLTPYVAGILPGYGSHRVLYALVGDLVLVTSLFVLGGDFWEKLRALFIHRARVVIPPASERAER